MFELRPYQHEAIEAIDKAEAQGIRRPLVAHATGLGKTVVFCNFIAQRSHRCLVLVHRDELIRQTVEKIRMIAPELSVGVVKAERNELDAGVIVASVQTLAHPKRRQQLPVDIQTIVVDEAHHVAAESYQRILGHCRAFLPDTNVLTVGFTATPERGDGVSLAGTWQKIVHEMPILRGILDGYLVDVRGQTVGTDADLEHVKTSRGDLAVGELGDALENSDAITALANAYVKYASDRKGLVFTPTVHTAHLVAKTLTLHGIRAEAIDGGTDVEHRRAVLQRLKTGETQVVANCAVLTEGFDEPSVSCVVIARPTKSRPLFIQMIGRGTRIYPGKKDLLVLDIAGASERNDLVTLAELAGVTELAKKTIAEAVLEKEETDKAEDERDLARARATKPIDLFRSRMRWLPLGGGFVLPIDDRSIILVPNGDGWDVLQTSAIARERDNLIYQGLPLGYAQGIGEDLARRSKIAERDAWWAKQPPTAAQLGRLRRDGLPEDKMDRIRNRGQAADLITRIAARRAVRKYTRKAQV